MKTSITLIILGALIIFASIYIGWWMLSGVDSLLDETITISGETVPNVTPRCESLFDAARYSFFITAALGLIVIITAAVRNRFNSKRSPAIIQAVCGIIITLTSVFIIRCGCSFDYIVAIEGNPVLTNGSVAWITVLTGLFGVVVAILAAIQFFRIRS